jgi:hypothetical protein
VIARDQYVLVHLSIDTRSEAAGTFEQKVKTFANGTAEEYITVRVVSDFRRLHAKISNKNRFLSQKYPNSSKSLNKGLHMPRR